MLIDSNIIIYAAQPTNEALRQFISEHAPHISAVSYVEVLGYHRLTETERLYFEEFFATAPFLPLSQVVLENAIKLRQIRRMSLGDALVAGTALAHGLTLVTRNVDDFKWIAGLSLLNPFSANA